AIFFFFFQAEDGIRDFHVTGVQTCALPILASQINGATDVFLESPQNAIPHWIVVGIGWALIRDAQALALPDPGKPPRVLPVPDPHVGSGAGIGRPRTPALVVHLYKYWTLPSYATLTRHGP